MPKIVKTIKAKFTNKVLKPSEPIDLEEGQEVLVSIDAEPALPGDEKLKLSISTAGAWKGKLFAERMKQALYEGRLSGSRVEPDH